MGGVGAGSGKGGPGNGEGSGGNGGSGAGLGVGLRNDGHVKVMIHSPVRSCIHRSGPLHTACCRERHLVSAPSCSGHFSWCPQYHPAGSAFRAITIFAKVSRNEWRGSHSSVARARLMSKA